MACCILAGTHIYVACSAHGAVAEAAVLEVGAALLVACGIVETANHTIAECATLCIVEQGAVGIYIIVLRVVATLFESHRTPAVAHFREEIVVA